jgi:DNA-binding MarR family transcriptional regulator
MKHASIREAEAPAQSDDDPIGALATEFSTLMRSISRHKQHAIGNSRIDRMALMVLGTLSECGAARLSRIAERTGLDPSTVSRNVSDLQAAGLLERKPDPADRRATLLQATTSGRALMRRLALGRRKRLERLVTEWSQEEIREFGRLLKKLNAATDKYAEQNALELDEELNNG